MLPNSSILLATMLMTDVGDSLYWWQLWDAYTTLSIVMFMPNIGTSKTQLLVKMKFPEIYFSSKFSPEVDRKWPQSLFKVPSKTYRYWKEYGSHFFSLYSDSPWLTVTQQVLLPHALKEYWYRPPCPERHGTLILSYPNVH